LSEAHAGHKFSGTKEVIPELRVQLQESASDVKLKKNVLDENIALLGMKLTEVGIKVRVKSNVYSIWSLCFPSNERHIFFVANTFQIKPFHKGLVMQADVPFCFMSVA
jgi:hypothetical protein